MPQRSDSCRGSPAGCAQRRCPFGASILATHCLLALRRVRHSRRPNAGRRCAPSSNEKPSWQPRRPAKPGRAGACPEAVQMAIIHQESRFQPPRPARTHVAGSASSPGPRPSSAYGYGQVIDTTWDRYRERDGPTLRRPRRLRRRVRLHRLVQRTGCTNAAACAPRRCPPALPRLPRRPGRLPTRQSPAKAVAAGRVREGRSPGRGSTTANPVRCRPPDARRQRRSGRLRSTATLVRAMSHATQRPASCATTSRSPR